MDDDAAHGYEPITGRGRSSAIHSISDLSGYNPQTGENDLDLFDGNAHHDNAGLESYDIDERPAIRFAPVNFVHQSCASVESKLQREIDTIVHYSSKLDRAMQSMRQEHLDNVAAVQDVMSEVTSIVDNIHRTYTPTRNLERAFLILSLLMLAYGIAFIFILTRK